MTASDPHDTLAPPAARDAIDKHTPMMQQYLRITS
jgi:hypothetical protein